MTKLVNYHPVASPSFVCSVAVADRVFRCLPLCPHSHSMTSDSFDSDGAERCLMTCSTVWDLHWPDLTSPLAPSCPVSLSLSLSLSVHRPFLFQKKKGGGGREGGGGETGGMQNGLSRDPRAISELLGAGQ